MLNSFFENGFDAEEADCGGIVIESKASMVMDYNTEMCSGDPLFVATVSDQKLGYGLLAHSHLNQVLENIQGGFVIPDDPRHVVRKVLGPGNCIELALLAVHDATMAEYVKKGLLIEVLDASREVD